MHRKSKEDFFIKIFDVVRSVIYTIITILDTKIGLENKSYFYNFLLVRL